MMRPQALAPDEPGAVGTFSAKAKDASGGLRPSPLPFLRMGTVSARHGNRARHKTLEKTVEDLLENLANEVPNFAGKSLTIDDFSPLHMFYLLRTVVPVLSRGLEELSMTWSTQTTARCTPLQFLASYLMRHNPKFKKLHGQAAGHAPPQKRYASRRSQGRNSYSRAQGSTRRGLDRGRSASSGKSRSDVLHSSGDARSSNTINNNNDNDDDYQEEEGEIDDEEETVVRAVHRFCAQRAEHARIAAREKLWETEQGSQLLQVWRACCSREGDCMNLEMVRENIHVFRSASMHITLDAEEIFQLIDKSKRGRASFEDFEEVMGNMLVDNSTALSAARRLAPTTAFAKTRAGNWAREKALEKLEARLDEHNINARTWFQKYTGAARTSLKRVDLEVCLTKMASTFDLNIDATDMQEALENFGDHDLVDYRDFIRIAAEIVRLSTKRTQAMLRAKSRRVMQARFTSNVNRVQVYLRAIEKVEVKLRRLERATKEFQETFSELQKVQIPKGDPSSFSESMRSLDTLLQTMSGHQEAVKKDIRRARRLSLDPSGCSPTSQREIETLIQSSHERVQESFRGKTQVESILGNIGAMFGGTVPQKRPPPSRALAAIPSSSSSSSAPASTRPSSATSSGISSRSVGSRESPEISSDPVEEEVDDDVDDKSRDDASIEDDKKTEPKEAESNKFTTEIKAETTTTTNTPSAAQQPALDMRRLSVEPDSESGGPSQPVSPQQKVSSAPRPSARTSRTSRSRKSTRASAKDAYVKGKLTAAAKSGNVDELIEIFTALQGEMNGETLRKQAVNEKDRNGSTPLMHCAWPGDLAAARVLLENGADPVQTNLRLNTPLHFAFERGHREFAELLLAHGAGKALKSKNALGKTPADLNPELCRQLGLK